MMYTAKLKPPGSAMRLERVAITLNYLLLNLNSINETLSVLYLNTYDCVYRFSLVWLCCDS